MSIFTKVPMSPVGRSTFDLTHSHKLTCNMGELIPIFCEEVLPSDRFTQSVQTLVRLQPLVAPMMHEVDITVHYFYVPNRILWSNFENFIFAASDASMPAAPHVGDVITLPGTLPDYLGLPTNVAVNNPSALPFAAYQAIYDNYYRDENLIAPINYKLLDGYNSTNFVDLTTLRKRAWGHDYFTSALPFAQKGEAVSIPIAGFSDTSISLDPAAASSGVPANWVISDGNPSIVGSDDNIGALFGGTRTGRANQNDNSILYDPNGTLIANTSELDPTAATINDLRNAFRLQEWFEKNARGGTRMVEGLLSHFGVRSDDLRLQRPKYLGGSKQPLVVSEVLQTSATDDTSPQGNMSGHGISVGGGRQFSYVCPEHGWIIGIMSILPRTAYCQGVHRKWNRDNRLDYAWPTFANLGEQPILNKEIYNDNTPPDLNVFGYIPRYSEYKYAQNRISGDFRTSLNFWTMTRIFDSRPALNGNFVTADPTKRVFAVTDPDVDSCIVQVLNICKANRPLPYYGVPKL